MTDSSSGIRLWLINDASLFPQYVFRLAAWSCDVFQAAPPLLSPSSKLPISHLDRRRPSPLLDVVEIFVEARERSDVSGIWRRKRGGCYRRGASRSAAILILTFARPPFEADVVDGDVAAQGRPSDGFEYDLDTDETHGPLAAELRSWW